MRPEQYLFEALEGNETVIKEYVKNQGKQDGEYKQFRRHRYKRYPALVE